MFNITNPIAQELKLRDLETKVNGKTDHQVSENFLSECIARDKGIVGRYNGDFPVTNPVAGNMYFDPISKKNYKCIASFSGTVSVPDSKFINADIDTLSSDVTTLNSFEKIKVFRTGFLNLKKGAYWYQLPSFILSERVVSVIPREFSNGLAKIRFVGITGRSVELDVLVDGATNSLDIYYSI